MVIGKKLLNILICPACKNAVEENENEIVCSFCGIKYQITGGIPVMLVEEEEEPGASS